MKPRTILLLVLVGLVVVIILQNTQVVTLRVLTWQVSMSQVLLLPLTMLVGFILGALALWMRGGSR